MQGIDQPGAAAADHFRRAGGAMGALIAARDWADTPLGPIAAWPAELVTSLSICLSGSSPTMLYWGPEHRMLFNDAWAEIPGGPGAAALGQSADLAHSQTWQIVRSRCEEAERTGLGSIASDLRLPLRINGHVRETYWNYSITPIVRADGTVLGLFNQGQDTTARVAGLARAALIIDFGERVRRAVSPQEVLAIGLELLGRQLGVARVGYAEIDDPTGIARTERCWTDGRLPDLTGDFRIEERGTTVRDVLARGEIQAIDDVATDARLTPDHRAGYADMATAAELIAPILTRSGLAAILYAQEPAPRHWDEQQIVTLRRMAERLWQEISRTRNELQLRDSEQRYRLIFEQAQDMIFTADLDQRITAANAACAAAAAVPAAELIGRRLTDFLPIDDGGPTRATPAHTRDREGTTRYEARLIRPDGAETRLEVNAALATDADGRPRGLHGIARDITERRAFEDRQAALIDELNHRVKNTLALVQGLAMQSFRAGRPPGEAQDIFQHRLGTLAAAHDLLTRSRWEGASVADLALTALSHYDDPQGRLAMIGPAIRLHPKAAVSLVLVFNELATNAAKYGALSRPAGRVAIDWSLDDGLLRIGWREEGGPPACCPERRGFGLRMIERALANDLGARVAMDFTEAGFRLAVEAPRGKIQA